MKRAAVPWILVAVVANAPAVVAQRAQAPSANSAATSSTIGFRLVPAASHVSYSVDEVFIEENNRFFTAVGKTAGVSGEILLHNAHPNPSRVRNISVDLRTLTSDSERRDRAIRERFLESRRYPYARVDSAIITGLPGHLTPGRAFAFQLHLLLEASGEGPAPRDAHPCVRRRSDGDRRTRGRAGTRRRPAAG